MQIEFFQITLCLGGGSPHPLWRGKTCSCCFEASFSTGLSSPCAGGLSLQAQPGMWLHLSVLNTVMHINAAADALDMGYRAGPPHPQGQLPAAFKEHRPSGEGRKKHNIVDVGTRTMEKVPCAPMLLLNQSSFFT